MRVDNECTAYGDCTIYTFDRAHESRNLSEKLRRLIPERMLATLDGFPGSMTSLAESTTIPELSGWLRSATESRPSIVIYERADGYTPDVYLRLDFGPAAGSSYSWHVFLDFLTGTPEQCPPPLVEVYEMLGGIMHEYGGSSTLISPHEVMPLASLFPDYENLYLFDPDSGIDPHDWWPWYECDGDYLCYHADNTSRWFGNEWAPPEGTMSTRQCVADLFSVLLTKRHFNGSAQERLHPPE